MPKRAATARREAASRPRRHSAPTKRRQPAKAAPPGRFRHVRLGIDRLGLAAGGVIGLCFLARLLLG